MSTSQWTSSSVGPPMGPDAQSGASVGSGILFQWSSCGWAPEELSRRFRLEMSPSAAPHQIKPGNVGISETRGTQQKLIDEPRAQRLVAVVPEVWCGLNDKGGRTEGSCRTDAVPHIRRKAHHHSQTVQNSCRHRGDSREFCARIDGRGRSSGAVATARSTPTRTPHRTAPGRGRVPNSEAATTLRRTRARAKTRLGMTLLA
jgi:hypothetical protein